MRRVVLTREWLEILACRDVYPRQDVAKHFKVSERRVMEIWRVKRTTNVEPPNIRVKKISREILEEDIKILLGRNMTARDITSFYSEGGKKYQGVTREIVKEIIRGIISEEPFKYQGYEIETRRSQQRRNTHAHANK